MALRKKNKQREERQNENHPQTQVIHRKRSVLVILIGFPSNFRIVPEMFLLSAVSLLNFNTRWLSYDRHLVHCPLEFPASAV